MSLSHGKLFQTYSSVLFKKWGATSFLTFTEEILDGKLHYLVQYSEGFWYHKYYKILQNSIAYNDIYEALKSYHKFISIWSL